MEVQVKERNLAFRVGRSTTRSPDRVWYVGAGAIVVIALAIGLFGRLHALGDYPLAIDEYYFIQSVKAILKYGVPYLDTGGYYPRGVLVQYLTAAAVLVFGDGAFAYRLPAAVFSIATVPLAYLYGKRLAGIEGGIALTVMLLISSWEIEFARFARMYSALQFFTLLFFIALESSLERARGWRIYAPHVILVLARLAHEFGILLAPFLLVPALSLWNARGTGRENWFRYVLISLVTIAVSYRIHALFDASGDVGVGLPFSADVVSTWTSPWILPVMPFFEPRHAETAMYVGLGLAAALVCCALIWWALGRAVPEGDVLASLVLLSAVLHQFLIVGALLLVMAARRRTVRFGNRRVQVMLAVAAGLVVFWLTYAVSSQRWVAETFRPELGFSPNYGIVKGLIRVFLGWPGIINTSVLPWLANLPLIGFCFLCAAAYQMITKAHAGVTPWARSPIIFIAVFVLLMGVFELPYSTIRYTFFIYPSVLALILLSATEAARALLSRWGREERVGGVLGASACCLMFLASSDFNIHHIAQVAEPSVRYRLGEFERYEDIWYLRPDYETPAQYINEGSGFREDDRIVVVGLPPVSFYLRPPHATYYYKGSPLFYDHSRARGTIDRWSGQRFLSTPADLREYTKCAPTVWLVRAVSPVRRPFEVNDVWRDRLVTATEVFRSADDRLAVIRTDLRVDSVC